MTAAGCPSLILEMSDSLKATVIVIEPVLTISMRPVELARRRGAELLEAAEAELAGRRRPVELLVPELELALDPDPLDPDPEFELAPLLDTVSPGETSATLTTVPVAGAYRWVWCRAFSAFWTVASAPSTAAWADAMLAAIVSALVVLVCPLAPEPPPDRAEPEPEEPEPPALEALPPAVVRVGVVRVGVVRVGVVRVGVVRVGVVRVGVVVGVAVVVVWVVLKSEPA